MRHRKSVARSLMMISQLGFSIVVPVLFCILVGFYLDQVLGTRLMIWWILLGFGTGGYNGWKMVKSVLAMNERDDKEEDSQEEEDKRIWQSDSENRKNGRTGKWNGKQKG